jgi:hypothetical protein
VAVDLSFFRSQTAQNIRAEGRAEGRAEDVLQILDVRGIPVADEARTTISGCTDLDTIDIWFNRAITATSIDEVLGDGAPTTA